MAKKYQSVFDQLKKSSPGSSSMVGSPNIAENRRLQEEKAQKSAQAAPKESALASSPYASVFTDLGIIGTNKQAVPNGFTFPSDIGDGTPYPGMNSTGNRTLDMFLAQEANRAKRAEQSTAQAAPAPVQKLPDISSVSAVNTKNAHGGTGGTFGTAKAEPEKKQSPFQAFLDSINYANARGGQAIDNAMTNLNAFGEGVLNSLRSADQALQAGARKTGSGLSVPNLFSGQSGRPVLQSSASERGGVKTPEELSETAGASNVRGKANEGYTAALEKAARQNVNAGALAEIEREYQNVSSNPVVHALGDLSAAISGQVPYVAMQAIPGVGQILAPAMRGFENNVSAYVDARNEGAGKTQARTYASREALNQSVGDILIGGIAGQGGSILGKVAANTRAGRYLAKAYGTFITSPLGKTAIRTAGTMVGEGLEEALQDVITSWNKRHTYDPDAKVSGKELLYSGILGGLTAGVFSAPGVPSTYRAYKSDFDTVNAFSQAAAAVRSQQEADVIIQQIDDLMGECTKHLGLFPVTAGETDFDTRARYEYLYNGLKRIRDTLDTDTQAIVYGNNAFDDAVESAADAPVGDIIYEAANLVTVVSETVEPDEDVVNATIDRLNEAKREAYNQETNRNVTDAVRREWEMQRRLYEMLENVLRNRKPEVKQAIAGLLAAPEEPNVSGEVTENGLTSASGNAIISGEDADLTVRNVTPAPEVGNPVMLVDGESLTAPAAPVQTPAGEPAYNLIRRNYTDTRDGTELNLFTIGKSLSGDDYKALKKAIESVGGHYSRFAKGFLVPDEALDKLPDALRRLNVGIDESQYTPRAQSTAEPEAAAASEAETPQAGPVPQFEVLNGERGAQTETAEQTKRPEFEVYTGGDVVPVNGTQEVTGAPGGTEVSENGPDVRQNAGPQNGGTQTEAGAAPVTAGPLPEAAEGTKVNVNAPEGDEEEERILSEWKDSAKKLERDWSGISKEEFSSALNTLAEAAIASWPKNNGIYAPDSNTLQEWLELDERISKELAKNAGVTVDNPAYEQYREARNYLRTTPIYYRPEDVIGYLGRKEYYNWKRSMFGRLKLTTDRSKGSSVGKIFDEFADLYPAILDISIMPETERLMELGRAAEWMSKVGRNRTSSENPYEQDLDQAAAQIGAAMYMEVYNHINGIKEEATEKKPEKKPSAQSVKTSEASKPDSESAPEAPATPKPEPVFTASEPENTEKESVPEKSDAAETSVTEATGDASVETAPYKEIGGWVLGRLENGLKIDKKDLQTVSNNAYGGTMAEGRYDVKDMTDALELGVNRYIIKDMKNHRDIYTAGPEETVATLGLIQDDILANIPTQTSRTDEQIRMQQFSTPPNIAFLANWAANITPEDTVLEPSAGIGGLASFAKGMGAKVIVNELSDRRLSLLKTLPFDGFYNENAEQIDNILPESVKPTVVVMNPPFSANGRTKNKTANAIPHIEAALDRLEPGGRLVAILGGGREDGGGMSDSAPSFKGWWNDLRKEYSIRANIGIDGKNYAKYGTAFNVRMVIIDKTGPQQGETLLKSYTDLSGIPGDLEEIRNDRQRNTGKAGPGSERDGTVEGGTGAASGGSRGGVRAGTGSGKRASDSGAADAGGRANGGEQPRGDLSSERSGGTADGVGLEPEEPQNEVRVPDGERESGRGGERGTTGRNDSDGERERPDKSGGVDAGESGGGDRGQSPELVPTGTGVPGASGEVLTDDRKPSKRTAAENDDGIYASYRTTTLRVKGAKPHPAKLVESSAMSAVPSPALKYKPTLDQAKIDAGVWSDAQLESISYAGQAHSEKLPDGRRKGFFDGDGTGVGKGRQIAGIIMDNFNQGRRRAIWISENFGLMEDAKRDWVDVGGNEADIFPFSDAKKKKGLPASGIMFISYDTLRTKSQKTGVANLDLVEEWFGKDFDGVIVFDEAHNMGNLTPVKGFRGTKKPAAKAIAGDKLQNDLPNARVSYFSATGATNIENLSYASRLGLWGQGTSFRDAKDFVSKIGSAGISAMELVARDMKAMGVYLARSISYDGVKYDNLDHKLTKAQKAMYDRMSEGWQVVLQNFDKAMKLTDSDKSSDVKRQRGMIYTNMQQFYNQVLTSMAMPSVIQDIEKELSAGHSCVIQLVNTNEAAQDREVKKAKETGEELDSLDITPRQLLVGYVENYFPIYQYEKYIDENGNELSRLVVDSAGNPVINRKAQAIKEALIADLNEISIPEGPLDLLINHFGTKQVAEVTGRSQRVVNQEDENGNTRKVLERRDSKKANIADAAAFQNGEKRILVFSNAGSTGRSFHADKRAKNQQQRIHYVLQPGWRADKAVQGFGRTHRSNQVSSPVFRLVSTDVKGHKRFVTSIARRLDQLGALTKGQRQTGSGVFGEKDNLESPLSAEALHSFYRKLGNNMIPGLDPKEVLGHMGLVEKFYDDMDQFRVDNPVSGEITTFLNRLLALPVDEQNEVFDAFEKERDAFYQQAIDSGTLDRGLENVKADKVEIEQEDVVYTDEKTGAETKYVKAKVYNKPRVVTTVDAAQSVYHGFSGVYRLPDGSVRAAYRIADSTTESGDVVKRFLLVGPNQGKASRYVEATLKRTCTEVPKREWQKAWDEELARVPEYNEDEVHMITGALLPVWNKLPMDGNIKAQRITAADGTQYLGRVISKASIDGVLRGLDVSVKKETYSGKQLYDAILQQGSIVTINGSYGGVHTLARRRVSGENRIEISGGNLFNLKSDYPDIIQETVNYARRYFIPTGKKGEAILDTLAQKNGVRSVSTDENDGNLYSAGLSRGKWGRGKRDRKAQVMSINDLVDEAVRIFGIPISTGRMGAVPRNVEGVFKRQPETIRTRQYGNIPAIAHEIGHWFDGKYNFHASPYINELISEFSEDLDRHGYSPEQYSRESVAEYFREYLSDKDEAEQKFPTFTAWMYQHISDADTRRLSDYAAMTNGYFAADLDRRASAQVHYRTDDNSVGAKAQVAAEEMKRDPWEYLGGKSRDFVRAWFDDLVDLRGFGNTYDLAMYEKQARRIAYGRLTSAMTDKNGFIVGRSLADVLSEAKIDDRNARTFDEYLIARVALDHFDAAERGEKVGTLIYGDEELNDANSVMDRISRYERENPTFRQAAEGVYEYERHLLDLAVNSGLMSEDLRERLNKLYPHYVPLYRVMDDRSQKTRGAARGYANQNTPIARFKGSGRDIYSPIESIIQNTEKFTASAMRNDVMVEFADYIDSNDGLGWIAEEIPEAKILDFISTDDLKKRLMDFAQTSDRLESMNEKERIDLYHNLLTFVGDTLSQWKPSPKQGKRVVFVMRGGKRTYYEIHDEGLYKALTNMDAPQFDLVTKFFGAVTRANKFFYTSSNPQFIFTNPQRDIVTGYISSTTTDNPVTYVVDFFKAYADAVRNNENYKEYMRSGGGYMGSVTGDYNILKRVKNDVVQPNRSAIRKFMDSAAKIVPRLVDAGETASRLAEWKRAVAQGDSNVEAMRKAQEVTVNFARGGRVVKQINQYIPFFMAGFNALAHDYDLFVNGGDGGGGRNGNNGYGLDLSPEGKRRRSHAWMKWILTTGMLAFLTWLYNYVIAPRLTGETEEEVKQRCDDLSNYNKNAFYNVYIGDGKFFRIKKTQDMAIPATILERMAEYYVLDQKDALGGVGDFVLDNILPVNPFGGESLLDGALNVLSEVTMVGTAVDLARNKDFKGSPIVSTSYQYLPKEEQYKENTSEVWIALGLALHMSPIQLQYAAEDNFGWAARLIDNMTPLNGQRSFGIANKLVSDSVYSTDILNNFYDQKDVYEKAAKAYKADPNSGRYALEDVYGAYKYGKVAGLYTDLNRLTKAEGDNDLSRSMRAQTNALIQTVNEERISELDRAVIDLADLTGTDVTDVAPYLVIPEKLTYKSGDVKVELPMDYDDMVMYYTQAQTAFENAYGRIFEAGYSDDVTAAMLAEAKKAINKSLRDAWLKQLVARKVGG